MLVEKISVINNTDKMNFKGKNQKTVNLTKEEIAEFDSHSTLLNTLVTLGIINKNSLEQAKILINNTKDKLRCEAVDKCLLSLAEYLNSPEYSYIAEKHDDTLGHDFEETWHYEYHINAPKIDNALSFICQNGIQKHVSELKRLKNEYAVIIEKTQKRYEQQLKEHHLAQDDCISGDYNLLGEIKNTIKKMENRLQKK